MDIWDMQNPAIIKKFTVHLKKLRKAKGFSQQALADTANIDRKTIQRIENGTMNPSLDTLISISEAMEIPLKDLVDF